MMDDRREFLLNLETRDRQYQIHGIVDLCELFNSLKICEHEEIILFLGTFNRKRYAYDVNEVPISDYLLFETADGHSKWILKEEWK